ncbi:MAG: zinc-dependent metalloprotease [Burkholderiales bacterium]|nr:zinc-dependent metalloprotease [Burkholderiales bacterium]
MTFTTLTHPTRPARWRAGVPLLPLLALLSACAQLPSGSGTPASAADAASGAASGVAAGASAPARGASGVAAGAAAPVPGQPPAFATVIKDAQKSDGSFTIWKKDEKVWLELAEKDFGAPLFLSPKLAAGIGEGRLLGGSMAGALGGVAQPQVVEFRRVFHQVQLIARNTAYVAKDGTPAARAVKAAFSSSLVNSVPVASQPHPERKTVLIDASSLFAGDLLGLGMLLQRSYRQSYSWDGRNSAMVQARAKPDVVVFETQNHFATGNISVAQPGSPPGAPVPGTPDTLPDVRSMFLTVHYSLSRLPEQAMAARVADARIGHFVSQVSDFSDDLERSPRRRMVNRWRLEKKDPTADVSEPVKPITYWVDANVPEKYRASITAGILEWNKAFEKIGFKNAIVVQQQPDKADFDTLDMGVASVRWMTNAYPGFGAIGPSHVDPRSGEILDADISFESLSSRSRRSLRTQILPARGAAGWAQLMQASDYAAELGTQAGTGSTHSRGAHAAHGDTCTHADEAADQLSYGLDVLAARGDIDPAGPEAEAFVQAYIKDVAMHEVGHTLGLRHNFRASRVYADAELSDPTFTADHALSGSVMEYLPINLPRPGEKATAPFQTTLGPYDYWAIEYAYKPLAPEQEAAELGKIAARSAEPQLAYATDEDNYLGLDPESLQFDLGNDPVAYASKRLAIAQDLLRRIEARKLDASDNYSVLRRSVSYTLRDVGQATGILARQIGGLRTLRDYPNTGRDPLQPVPAARQRAALDVLASGVLSASGLTVSSELQRRLAPDFLERADALAEGSGAVATDYTPGQILLDLQKALIGQLMSDGVAVRLLDAESKAGGPDASLRLGELYGRIQRELWSELAAPRGDIPAMRRELQRDQVNRLVTLLIAPGRLRRADARSLVRVLASDLQTRIVVASKRPDLSDEARAHLRDCAESLREALSARLTRSGA